MTVIPNQLTFNGEKLSDILYIQKFNKGVRLGRSANYSSKANKKGSRFEGTTSDVVTFTTDYLFKPEVSNKKEKLAKILNVNEPKALLNSSEPGIVYYAFPVSNIESDETSIFGGGTITWEIPDGVAYSSAEYVFSNINTGNRDYIIVDNPGTEPMELEMTAVAKSEMGFLGLETEDGESRILLGDIQEVDGETRSKSVTLFNDHMTSNKGWSLNNGVIPKVTANPRQQGTFGYRTESPGEGYAYPTSYGEKYETDWGGPSLTKIVPPDSNGAYPKNWDATYRVDFNTDGSGTAGPYQVGHSSMTFIDQNDKIICSVVLEDTSPTSKKSNLAIYVGDRRVVDRRNTNNYYVTARPGKDFHIWVERFHKLIQVHMRMGANNKDNINPKTGRPYPTETFDFYTEDETQELRKITYYAGRYMTYPTMTNNLLRAVNVVKHNVDYWFNIPNKFKAGDEIYYGRDGEHTYITVNGMNMMKLRDPGSSSKLQVPPGRSTIYIAQSDWATPADVTVRGRARFVI